ncbi:hypothetical protein D1872_343920 [compost metagenome]
MARPNSSSCSGDTADGESIIKSLPALFLGNAIKSLMDSLPAKRAASLSNPKAIPP